MRSKKAIKNISFSLLLQFCTIVCGFITPVLIISQYGSEVNGLISSITQFLAYIVLLESGFGPVLKSALYKPIAKKSKKEIEGLLKSSQNFFRKISVIFIFYIIILIIFYPIIVNSQFDSMFTISLIIIISVSTFFEYFFGITYRLYLSAAQETYIISIIQLVTLILNTILIVLLIKLNFNIIVVKIVSTLIYTLRPLLQYFYVTKIKKIKVKNDSKNINIPNKWDGLSQHIASTIHSNTDVMVLTLFCRDMVLVSIYSVYYLVINGVKQLVKSFSNSIDSSFGDMIARNEFDNLKEKFNIYETGYFIIISIVYICTFLLIVPFVSAYTNGISDANYIQYSFGGVLVLGEFVWAIRQPYNELIKAAGHFKQTRRGSWIEALLNIVLSILLVYKIGLVGIAIGTLIAMIYRTTEFIYYTNRYILKQSILNSFKKILLILFEVLIALFLFRKVPLCITYMEWIKNAVIVFVYTISITIILNLLFHKKDILNLVNVLKQKGSKNEKKCEQ